MELLPVRMGRRSRVIYPLISRKSQRLWVVGTQEPGRGYLGEVLRVGRAWELFRELLASDEIVWAGTEIPSSAPDGTQDHGLCPSFQDPQKPQTPDPCVTVGSWKGPRRDTDKVEVDFLNSLVSGGSRPNEK